VSTIFEGVKHNRAAVNDDNLVNALSSDEQEKNFTTIWPEFLKDGKVADNVVYAGIGESGRHLVVCDDGKTIKEFTLKDFLKENLDISVRFYLGTRETDKVKNLKTDVFACTPRGKQISSFEDQNLEGKTFYYLKLVPSKVE
jgi:hypothetical protein